VSPRPLAVVTTPRLVLLAVTVLGLLLRWQLVDIQSGDYRAFLDPWYAHLADAGGFAGLGDSFSNDNTPYLVLLAALTYLPITPLIAIKLISVVFDLALAGIVLLLIRRLRPAARWLPATPSTRPSRWPASTSWSASVPGWPASPSAWPSPSSCRRSSSCPRSSRS